MWNDSEPPCNSCDDVGTQACDTFCIHWGAKADVDAKCCYADEAAEREQDCPICPDPDVRTREASE